MLPEAVVYIGVMLQLLGMAAAMYLVISGVRADDRISTVLSILVGVLMASRLFLGALLALLVVAGRAAMLARRQKTQNHDRLDS